MTEKRAFVEPVLMQEASLATATLIPVSGGGPCPGQIC